MEYTRGEWKLEHMNYGDYEVFANEYGKVNIACVYLTQIEPATNGSAKANATLISAAPDLYQALLAVYQDIDIPNTLGGSSELDISVQQALAKAEVK